jgi:hypothetical protein
MQSMTTGNPMYAFRDVPGKGKGLVAIEKISKGTRILSEEPTITVLASEFGSGPLMSKMPLFLQSRNLNPHSKPRCALQRCSKVSPVLLN